jgi:hypothetical protein
MIQSLIVLLIIALVLYLVWWIIGRFVSGTPHQIIGLVMALILLLYVLSMLKILPSM